MKWNLRLAYKLAAKANRKSHINNKRLYDRKDKPREFEVQDLLYMYNPALKPGLIRKIAKPWIASCQITKKIIKVLNSFYIFPLSLQITASRYIK